MVTTYFTNQDSAGWLSARKAFLSLGLFQCLARFDVCRLSAVNLRFGHGYDLLRKIAEAVKFGWFFSHNLLLPRFRLRVNLRNVRRLCIQAWPIPAKSSQSYDSSVRSPWIAHRGGQEENPGLVSGKIQHTDTRISEMRNVRNKSVESGDAHRDSHDLWKTITTRRCCLSPSDAVLRTLWKYKVFQRNTHGCYETRGEVKCQPIQKYGKRQHLLRQAVFPRTRQEVRRLLFTLHV